MQCLYCGESSRDPETCEAAAAGELPDGYMYGCGKCRKQKSGCAECRPKAEKRHRGYRFDSNGHVIRPVVLH